MSRARLLTAFVSTAVLFLAPIGATGQSVAPDPPVPGDGIMTMVLAGDAIITRALSPYQEPEFLSMIERIRAADLSFVNLEVLLHDYEPYPSHQSGGTYMRADPAMAGELAWAGFDMVSFANNHTGDYGPLGARLTREHTRAAGLVGSGSGENLFEAREAKFLDTADGRVALISLASTFPESSMAGNPGAANPGRPGVNFLRHDRTRIITQEQMDALRAGLEAAGIGTGRGGSPRLNALGTRFEVGDAPGNRTTPNADDVEAITRVVSDARRLADYVVVSIHAHESGPGGRGYPADFIVEFAHAVIDAGADMLVGHGPHVLRGVEVYNGKPIFYSLGDFMFQNETLLRLPEENFSTYDLDPDAGVSAFNFERYSGDTRGFPADEEIWESVLAVPSFSSGELVEVRFFPLTLQFGTPSTVRGRPLYADAELGRKILGDLIERSERFGTQIEDAGGVGVLRIAADGGR